MKGIILAGGSGTRLGPITKSVSKQLLPVYDKPMIYYPLSTLMLAGVREVMIITTPVEQDRFIQLLGDGSQLGISIQYAVQEHPDGLPCCFQIAREFIGSDSVMMILGDNLIHGSGMISQLKEASLLTNGSICFACRVKDPERSGVIEFDRECRILSMEEKPEHPKSNYAIVGLYVFDNTVVDRVSRLKPSARGELEMVELQKQYWEEDSLRVFPFYRGTVWLDTGLPDSLLEANQFVKAIQDSKNQYVGCIEEVAYECGFISKEQLHNLVETLPNCDYRKYLEGVLK